MNNKKETLGERIAGYRKQLNFTQEQMAEMLGVSAQAVSKWENDITCPDIFLLPKLANLFGISVDCLLGEVKHGETVTPQPSDKAKSNITVKIKIEHEEDKVNINLPYPALKAVAKVGKIMPGGDALKDIDLDELFECIEQGVTGKIVDIDSKHGKVEIFVE